MRILFCWGQLSTKTLIKKSQLSESQVYNTLKNLEGIGLVVSVERGIYTYSKSPFANKLKDAYISHLVQIIGKELYNISSELDTLPFNVLDKQFSMLVKLWEPLLDEYYRLKASSLAGHILEKA